MFYHTIKHRKRIFFHHITVYLFIKQTKKPLEKSCITGSEINSFRQAPTGKMWATRCEILVASAKFLVALATRKAQFPTLYYTVIKHSGQLRTLNKCENRSLQLMFSTFFSCSQMPIMPYHSIIHGFGFFTC